MRVVETVEAMRRETARWASSPDARDTDGAGFVPTMGALHAGHLSLARRARAENAVVVASVFVNPTQFGPHEDLARYPRDLPRDLALLEDAGVDVVFAPSAEAMYPAGFATYITPTGALVERLEGAIRPGHFRGVATVVLKLLQITQPARAYFGQKDAQQVAVIRRMLADLNLPVALRVAPTVREADGLAMSSRNAYLDPEDRLAATALWRALTAGRVAFETGRDTAEGGAEGRADVEAVERAMRQVIEREPRAALDYAAVCDPDSFAPLGALRAPALLAVAARVGPARLIDNALLRADGDWEMGVRTGVEQA